MADLTTLLSKFLTSLYSGFGTTIAYNPAGVISVNTTAVSNTSTTETDLMTFALPGGAMGVNGKGVRISGAFTCAANGNTKTFRVYFGSTAIGTTGATTLNNTPVEFSFTVLRTSATAQLAYGRLQASPSGTTIQQDVRTSTPAETLSAAVTIKTTGQSGTGSNDITCIALVVEALP